MTYTIALPRKYDQEIISRCIVHTAHKSRPTTTKRIHAAYLILEGIGPDAPVYVKIEMGQRVRQTATMYAIRNDTQIPIIELRPILARTWLGEHGFMKPQPAPPPKPMTVRPPTAHWTEREDATVMDLYSDDRNLVQIAEGMAQYGRSLESVRRRVYYLLASGRMMRRARLEQNDKPVSRKLCGECKEWAPQKGRAASLDGELPMKLGRCTVYDKITSRCDWCSKRGAR